MQVIERRRSSPQKDDSCTWHSFKFCAFAPQLISETTEKSLKGNIYVYIYLNDLQE